MMRRPTPQLEVYAWHRQALLGRAVIVNEEPHCGWYQRRLAKGGVMVPCRIWLHQEIGEDGELVDDERLECEINGRAADVIEQWHWLADNPITEQRFNYLTARNVWAAWYAPDDPAANPRQPVDWLTMKAVF